MIPAGRRLVGIMIFLMGQLLFGEIILEADRYRVGVGETFTLRVTMVDKKEKNYKIEDIENFKEISYYTTTKQSIINGRKNSRYVPSYKLMAMNKGVYSLKVTGSKGESNIVDIEVEDVIHRPVEEKRACVLGEFGGLGLPVKGHLWQEDRNWGYVSYKNSDELTDAYISLLKKIPPLISMGLSAAVYTQTSDVEIEVNGLLTYDRKVIKMNIDTDTQWATWKGVMDNYKKNEAYLQGQIGNPEGEDRPNKSYYDPRKWMREGEISMVERLSIAFEDLNALDRN